MRLPLSFAMLALTLCAAAPLSAQTGYGAPEAFRTTAPTPIRAAPDADADVMMTLPAGYGPVEAVAPYLEGAPPFARIGVGEGDGWAALATLEPMSVEMLDGVSLPVGLMCFGTEPFWSLELTGKAALFSTPWLEADVELDIEAGVVAEARGGHPAALLMQGPAVGDVTAFIRAGDCSDGMSDQTNPWSAGVLTQNGPERMLIEGCCRLPLPSRQ